MTTVEARIRMNAIDRRIQEQTNNTYTVGDVPEYIYQQAVTRHPSANAAAESLVRWLTGGE